MAGFRSSEQPGSQQSEQYRKAAEQTVEHVQNQAQDAAHAIKARIGQVLDERKQTLADQVQDMAHALRITGEQLQEQKYAQPGHYVAQAGDYVDHAARYLHEHEANDLLKQVQGKAREHPALFLGGAFAVGLIAANLIRAAAQAEPENVSEGASASDVQDGASEETQSSQTRTSASDEPETEPPAPDESVYAQRTGEPQDNAGPGRPEPEAKTAAPPPSAIGEQSSPEASTKPPSAPASEPEPEREAGPEAESESSEPKP